jgi:hypothetical protein
MINSARGSQKSYRGETQKIEFNKALEGLFGVHLEPKKGFIKYQTLQNGLKLLKMKINARIKDHFR